MITVLLPNNITVGIENSDDIELAAQVIEHFYPSALKVEKPKRKYTKKAKTPELTDTYYNTLQWVTDNDGGEGVSIKELESGLGISYDMAANRLYELHKGNYIERVSRGRYRLEGIK